MSGDDVLPNGWVRATIGDVVVTKVAQAGPVGDGDFVYIDIGSIDNRLKKVIAPKLLPVEQAPDRAKQAVSVGDVLVSMTRPNLNAVAIVTADLDQAIASTGFDVLRPCLVEPRWLYYVVQSPDFIEAMSAKVQGALYPAVRPRDIRSYSLRLPPQAEQCRIVAEIDELLSDLDAGVAALQRTRTNLKRYRASVLNSAVDGTMTEEWRSAHPDVESASASLAAMLDRRRSRWETETLARYEAKSKAPSAGWKSRYKEPLGVDTSELGPLPNTWRWVSIDQVGEVQLGRQRSPENRSDRFPTKYIRAANITEDGLDMSDVLEMEFTPEELERYRMHKGDIVVSEASGSPDQVGKPAVWNDELPVCCFQNTVIRLRPEGIDSQYALIVLKQCYFSKVFARLASGVGINHLGATKFSKIAIPLAPVSEQLIIADEVQRQLSLLKKTAELTENNAARASRMRQSIIERAIEGEMVPQFSHDEPADALLARIHVERLISEAAIAVHNNARKNGVRRMAKERQPVRTIIEKYPEGVSPEVLFAEAGLNGEELNDVDLFYAELDTLVSGKFAEVVRSGAKSIVIKMRVK